ncbi:MAG: TonB-dependent receptor [Puia sp.]
MRITTLLLFVSALHVAAKTSAQKINLSDNHISVEQFFSQLEKQTGYSFLLENGIASPDQKLGVHVTNASLEQVLDQTLKPLNLSYRIENKFVYILKASSAGLKPADNFSPLPIDIHGRVTDSTGAPLSGASVTVKGSKGGTSTDQNGNYTIKVPDNSTLIFQSVGYKTVEMPVSGRSTIDITMEITNVNLAEVVVVGYGTQKKATLTGAVTVVKGSDIAKSPTAEVSNGLAGRAPGVIATNNSGQPGKDGSSIYIRGISTYSRATSPLIVIDGVANRPGGFDQIDPNDIESISVLKDASAAIYGAQAANGVILITTKRGKEGKPAFTFNYNQGFNTWAKTEKYLDAAQYAQMVNEISIFGGGNPTYTQDDITKFGNGSDPIGHPNTDWLSLATKKIALQDRASITLSGGSDKVKYYTSLGVLDQNGQFKNGVWQYKQYNFSGNIDAQVSKLFKLSFGSQLRWQNQEGSPLGIPFTFGSLTGALPTALAKNPNGSYALGGLSNGLLNPLLNSTDAAGLSTLKKLFSLNTARGRLDLPFIKGLYVDGFVSVDFGISDSTNWSKSYQVYAYDQAADTYTPFTENSALGLASLDLLNGNSTTITENIKLNYEHQFGKSSIRAFAAYEQSTFDYKYVSAHKEQFISQAIAQLDYGSSVNQTNNGNEITSARQNYFGRVNYSYNNTYILEGQLRYDGSDVFAQNKRWGLFPSVSAGWVISQYDWFKGKMKYVSTLKLRGSWGKLGNDNIPPFQFAQFYYINPNGRLFYNSATGTVTNYPAFSPGVVANPNATWESQTSTNLAIDGGLFDDKLNFTFEVFHQRRNNILAPPNATVPLYTGITLPDENIGIVDNKGLEALLSYSGSFGKLKYFISGNITYAKNKIIYQDEKLSSKPVYQALTGQPVNSYLLYKAIGVFKTQDEINSYATYALGSPPVPGDLKFADINKDGIIDQKDQIVQSLNSVPQIIYGTSIGVSYKSFSVDLLFQGQAKVQRYFRAVSGRNQNFTIEDFTGRSTPGNITGKPRAAEVYGSPQGIGNTYYVSNTSFLRLKNLELAYDIKSEGLRKYGMNGLRIYVNSFNVFTITKYKGLDPESVDGQGLSYPINRTFNLGASITF